MTAWKTGPHGPLVQLADNVWVAEGQLGNGPMKRVMTVARRRDGRLVIHSAVALDEPQMRVLEALGEPAFLLVPNAYHRIDAPRFKGRYPQLSVYAPRGAVKKVAERVSVTGAYEDLPADPDVGAGYLDGAADGEGLLTVRSSDGVTLVFNDLLFNMPHVPGAMGLVLRYVTGSSGGPKVSNLARWFLVKDQARFRAGLEKLAADPGLKRIVVSHHLPITEDAAGTLRAVAAAL